jgi:hypothetical protein
LMMRMKIFLRNRGLKKIASRLGPSFRPDL